MLNLPSGLATDLQVHVTDGGGQVGQVSQVGLGLGLGLGPAADAAAASVRTVGTVPVRYGGPYDFVGMDRVPLTFLHRSRAMKEEGMGEPVGPVRHGIWRCDLEEASGAVAAGLASPSDLMAVNGFCVWEKEPDGYGGVAGGGIAAEIAGGRFEKVPATELDAIWRMLLGGQQLLTEATAERNLQVGLEAWERAGREEGPEAEAERRDPLRLLGTEAWKRWYRQRLLP